MSTEWDIVCTDCDSYMDSDGLSDWRLPESLQAIIDHRRALISISLIMGTLSADFEIRVDFKRVDLGWLHDHEDHNLRARNEYGDFYTRESP